MAFSKAWRSDFLDYSFQNPPANMHTRLQPVCFLAMPLCCPTSSSCMNVQASFPFSILQSWQCLVHAQFFLESTNVRRREVRAVGGPRPVTVMQSSRPVLEMAAEQGWSLGQVFRPSTHSARRHVCVNPRRSKRRRRGQECLPQPPIKRKLMVSEKGKANHTRRRRHLSS